ncbi:major facilitator superfamily domain-containing protein [Elsinoe ampelina]|uniref:Major facilitator superfamily domain-containing protein n=1 Tax=Elsinoe ampelina TaxID=302913 RepID=A0A6A6GD86_9PEZI|nr:major facilitator superfamily domain-containing protein [Elsinoe ampelina]
MEEKSIPSTTCSRNDMDDVPKEEVDYRPGSSSSHSSQSKHPKASRDALQPETLAKIKSRQSTRSQKSYGGHDGYSVHEDHDQQEQELEHDTEGRRPKEYEVKFDGPTDPMNPRSRRKAQKWLINLILSCGSLCTTCTAAVYTQSYPQLERELGVSRIVATLGLSLYIMGLGIGPMFLGPLSEFYGRRPIYLASFSFFLIWLIPCAVAPNIQTLLVGRFLDGISGSAFLSVAGGTVGDLFDRDELSLPMMVYTASPFIGPEVGPVIGGFINQYTYWRWTFYVLLIWAGVELTLIFFFVPETYHPVVLKQKAKKLRKETGNDQWYAPMEVLNKSVTKTVLWSCIRPFQLLLLEPMCLALCLISSILLGILYLFFGAFQLIFGNNHGFSQSQIGMAFLGIFVGMIIGVCCDPLWRRNYQRLVRKNNGVSEPEFRLPPTIVGAIVVPFSLIGFAFTTYRSVHCIVPIIFSGFFGLGNIFCYGGIFTNHVETYPLYAASALAANSFSRSSFAAAFPLFGVQMYNRLGYQWASFILAGMALVLMPFPYIFFKYGKRIRGTSRFAQAP